MSEFIELERINIYGGTQTRAETNDDAVGSYAEAMEEGDPFPPITVFYDGSHYWLADGFHRFLAAKRMGKATIACDVREGGRSDALLFALGANSTNGLFRSHSDKEHAVQVAMEEWPDKSNAWLAEICKVNAKVVGRCRKENEHLQREEVVGKDGKTYRLGSGTARKRARKGEEPGKLKEAFDRRGEESGGSSGGGGGRAGKKASAEGVAPGGSTTEIEAEARKMIRNLEADPRELIDLPTATATDFALTAIRFFDGIKPHDKKWTEALGILQKWIDEKQIQQAATET